MTLPHKNDRDPHKATKPILEANILHVFQLYIKEQTVSHVYSKLYSEPYGANTYILPAQSDLTKVIPYPEVIWCSVYNLRTCIT